MGYTTKFSGSIALARHLTIPEAKELLEIAAACGSDARGPKDADRQDRGLHLQWVPAESLDRIVWDGGESFYRYVECMEWLCAWLARQEIGACGLIHWAGEDVTDRGEIVVVDRVVTAKKFEHKAIVGTGDKPLTLRSLGELALERLTS